VDAVQVSVTEVAVRLDAAGCPGAVGGRAATVATAVEADAAEATPVVSTALM
jgi:hypothetical protein